MFTATCALGAGFRALFGRAPVRPILACGESVDKRADVWAFGAVLYNETSTVVVVVSVLPAESVTTSVTM